MKILPEYNETWGIAGIVTLHFYDQRMMNHMSELDYDDLNDIAEAINDKVNEVVEFIECETNRCRHIRKLNNTFKAAFAKTAWRNDENRIDVKMIMYGTIPYMKWLHRMFELFNQEEK